MTKQLNSYVAWNDGRLQKAGKVMKVWKTKIAVVPLRYLYDTVDGTERVTGDQVEAPGDRSDWVELEDAKKFYRSVELADARQIALETGRQRRRADELAAKRADDKATALAAIRESANDFADSIAAMDPFGMGQLEFSNGKLEPCRMTYVVRRSKDTVAIDYAVWWLPDAEGNARWLGPRSSVAYVGADWVYIENADGTYQEIPVPVLPDDAVAQLLAEVVWEYRN